MTTDNFTCMTDAELEKFNDIMTQANAIIKTACERKNEDRFRNEAYVDTMIMQIGSFEAIRQRFKEVKVKQPETAYPDTAF